MKAMNVQFTIRQSRKREWPGGGGFASLPVMHHEGETRLDIQSRNMSAQTLVFMKPATRTALRVFVAATHDWICDYGIKRRPSSQATGHRQLFSP